MAASWGKTILTWAMAFVLAVSLMPALPSRAHAAPAATDAPGAASGSSLTAGDADGLSATDDWLDGLRFGTRTDPTDERFVGYELEPEFSSEVHEYTLYVPDTESGVYGLGNSLLAGGAVSSGADSVYAAYTDQRGMVQEGNLGAYGQSGN